MRKKWIINLLVMVGVLLFTTPSFAADGDPVLVPVLPAQVKADNSPADGDFVVYELTGTQFSFKTAAELGIPTIAGGLSLFVEETAWRTFYSDGSGDVQGLAFGADNSFYVSTGASGVPEFRALEAGDIPDISGTYQTILTNSAGLAGALSDETGTVYAVFSDSPVFTTTITTPEVTFTDADHSPASVGKLLYDNTATGLADGALAWHDGSVVRYIVDLSTLPSDDDYVVAYDADADKFYMKVDAGGNAWELGATATKTLSSGVADITDGTNRVVLAAETDTTDDVTELQAAAIGDVVILQPDTGDTITVKDGTYLLLQADFIMDDVSDQITLVCSATGANDTFVELARASNN